jgi:hypothetical protein
MCASQQPHPQLQAANLPSQNPNLNMIHSHQPQNSAKSHLSREIYLIKRMLLALQQLQPQAQKRNDLKTTSKHDGISEDLEYQDHRQGDKEGDDHDDHDLHR